MPWGVLSKQAAWGKGIQKSLLEQEHHEQLFCAQRVAQTLSKCLPGSQMRGSAYGDEIIHCGIFQELS